MAISKKSKLSSLFANGLTSCCSLLVMAPLSMAFAEEDDAVVDEEIVAVGSQIKGANIEGSLPVSVLNADDIDLTGATSGDELLRSIPQIGSTGFGDSRGGITGVNAARGDVGSVNLRSVGEGNTLVLVNGRRMVNHPITQNSSFDSVPIASVNSNTLPVSGIQRVEVLRDGAAALYGADAVAGVINYVLKDNYEGSELTVRYGNETDTSRSEKSISGAKGFVFNDGATNLLLTGAFTKKNGFLATEKDYTADANGLNRAPAEFVTSSADRLDGRSGLPGLPRVRFFDANGDTVAFTNPNDGSTDSLVRLRPSDVSGFQDALGRQGPGAGECLTIAGTTPTINDGVQDLCFDDHSVGRGQLFRQNRNTFRTISPDVERFNVFGFLNHELESGNEVYSEVAYYYSKAYRQWESAALLSGRRPFVSADYYWNPLGPVTFDDGRVNPNRIAGLDPSVVPVEGLGFELANYRALDAGPRKVEVTGESYRFLIGSKGTLGSSEWDYDTALLYSEADVTDTSRNRININLFQQQLLLDTPDAYNVFTGLDPSDPASPLDSTPNPQSSIDPFLTSIDRQAKSTIKLADFKVSNGSLFSLPAGDVGIALGVEWREEELNEDNDSLFDGSTPYFDPLNVLTDADGNVIPNNLSSAAGSSVRLDFGGDRKIISAYAELLVPILADVPGAQSLDAQIAVRHEDFNDFGGITRPKIALSWRPVDWLLFRSAFSEGFRAPNLVQLNVPGLSITTGVDDFALQSINDGQLNLNEGVENGNYTLTTAGNPDLEPEESENTSFGFVLTPADGLTITLDYWKIEATGTVGRLDDEDESRLDALFRSQGSSNPNVVRGAPTVDNPLGRIEQIFLRFRNVNSREFDGIDYAVNYNWDTDIGTFDVKFNAAQLKTFDQQPGADGDLLVAAGVDPATLGSAVGSQLEREFFPEWRGSLGVNWRSNDDVWGASLFGSYVGEVFEPLVRNADGDFYFLPSHTTFNAAVTHRGLFGEGSTVRFGINNLFDRDPPLAAEDLGFEGELHSNVARYLSLSVTKTFD
ncbi:TonB-dependent receptor [Porticoccus sp. W117]|uniref:TonB-dependent receptor domain-containing protein n=1 Tax=Porticoccus sp. W117 TaxID=3054777 RepID=UPI002592825D|nr:TonB-dependent receptor [Porticoccus sp. W117]MDM3871122.1 TonB-dependent receptor [Porticoccus sp. W117]